MKLGGLNQSPLSPPSVRLSVQHFIIAERQFEAGSQPRSPPLDANLPLVLLHFGVKVELRAAGLCVCVRCLFTPVVQVSVHTCCSAPLHQTPVKKITILC